MKYWKEILVIGIAVIAFLTLTLRGSSDNDNFTHTVEVVDKEEVIVVEVVEAKQESFDEAFRAAFNDGGYDSIFEWNGNKYIVNFKETE